MNKRNIKGILSKLLAVLFVAAVVVYVVVNRNTDGAYKPVTEGDKAPEFVLPLLNGGKADLAKEQGKVVFINFWATWCPACKEEMPAMQWLYNRLMKKYPGKFVMWAVNVDTVAVPGIVFKYMKKLNLSFPVPLDTEGKVKNRYKTTGVPETYIIDKRGIVFRKVIGPDNWRDPSRYLPIEALITKTFP